MSRVAIKKKEIKRKIKVPYDAELNELREWQDNMYNPGHYIGTGKLSYPLKNIAKNPKLKWTYLLYIMFPFGLGIFFMDFKWYNVFPAILVISVIIFIIVDSNRIIKKKYRK